ncbi:hypothetical protein PHYPSEUDO_004212 [Phytophthora pseudosyringae]|uniref:PiggyBac transposable element-derived protein domain-containing protein n=1 Tax=Phytophthora pseudosyringae TaxID=221518 RepID=A0A8T1VPW0_9STRA|nr:hypothetical protein PHYPSEUDO_004212 [Phytophthora pseudosyringae]
MATRCENSELDLKSATALWVAMLSLQNQQLPSPSGKRVVVMDSYYTRHAFAKHVLGMSSGEIRVIGTCRLNYVDTLSRPAVEAAILSLKDAAHGSGSWWRHLTHLKM